MFRFDVLIAIFSAALFMGPGVFLSGCLGGSDGVENPKMEMSFQPDDGNMPVSGRVSLYSKNLDPFRDSTPILFKDFSGKASVTFNPEEIEAAIRLTMAKTGRDSSTFKDTVLEFNVVAVAGEKEAFLGGFKYRKLGATAGFARVQGAGQTAYGSLVKTYTLPRAVKNFSGRIGLQGVALGLDYIFIPGSPYHSTIGPDSSFTMPRMSQGTYELVGADNDSSLYFKSTDAMSTNDSSYAAKAWGAVTFIPGI